MGRKVTCSFRGAAVRECRQGFDGYSCRNPGNYLLTIKWRDIDHDHGRIVITKRKVGVLSTALQSQIPELWLPLNRPLIWSLPLRNKRLLREQIARD